LILGATTGLAGRIRRGLLKNKESLSVHVAGRDVFQKIIKEKERARYDVLIDAALNSKLTTYSVEQEPFLKDELSRISKASTLLSKDGFYIYLSTNSIYEQDCTSPITEETPKNVSNVYAAVKLAGEDSIRSIMSNNLILRLPGIVSQGSRTNFAANIFQNLKTGKEIKIYSPDSRTSNYLCATQLLKVIQMAINHPHLIPIEKILNLYTWPAISRRQFVLIAAKLMSVKHPQIVLGNEECIDNIIFSNHHKTIQNIVDQNSFFGNVLSDLVPI